MQGSFKTIEKSDECFELNGLTFLTVKSKNLKGRGDICLYIPSHFKDKTDLPIYILLHGVYGSAWIWAMKGGAHLTAKRLINTKIIDPCIIAMPSDGLWGDGSGYCKHELGKDFEKWIVDDVILAVKENIPQAKNTGKICIGGLSMGGYGALSLGSKYPEKFAAFAAHSAITDLEQMPLFVEEKIEVYKNKFNQLPLIVNFKKNRNKLPPFRFDCGKTDLLIEYNRHFKKELDEMDIPFEYEEFEGGHEWPYWIKHLEKTLRFFNTNI